jgi:hypothetical protein
MVAGLLFIIGLISVLVSVVMLGFGAPGVLQMAQAALASPDASYLAIAMDVARAMSWSVAPIVGGLLLMGVARIIALLAAINRSLRGAA